MEAVKNICAGCPGFCCCLSKIYVTPEDVAVLASAGLDTSVVNKDKYLTQKNGACPFFDMTANNDKHCGIYEHRPKVCREYQHGNEVCDRKESAERWHRHFPIQGLTKPEDKVDG